MLLNTWMCIYGLINKIKSWLKQSASISCGGRLLALKDLWEIWQSCSSCCRSWSYWKERRSQPPSEAGGLRGLSGRNLRPGFCWAPWKEQKKWAGASKESGLVLVGRNPHSPWNRGTDAAAGMVEPSDIARLRGASWVEHVGGCDSTEGECLLSRRALQTHSYNPVGMNTKDLSILIQYST